MDFIIKDLNLAENGKKRIEWASQFMPTLNYIKKEFSANRPLKGIKIGACLHITKETANLLITLKEAGAEITLAASNPLSTQDDVAAALVKYYNIRVFGKRGETEEEYMKMLKHVVESEPDIIIDDGGDLIILLHEEYPSIAKRVWGASEETTTGVIRELALEKKSRLLFPIIATNNALIKSIVDNRFGTGQSALDGIIRATSILLAGKNVVVIGYGYVGKGIAWRARGLGANVTIVEVDPIKALEAHYDGFNITNMNTAATYGDIFITATGNINVIRYEHIIRMKPGAILCNAGHFNVEIDVKTLRKNAEKIERINHCVEKYVLPNGKHVYLLGEGRLVNLVCAEGHPSEVMNISFSLQALVAKYIAENHDALKPRVYDVPLELQKLVARYTLQAKGIEIESLTREQEEYLQRWK